MPYTDEQVQQQESVLRGLVNRIDDAAVEAMTAETELIRVAGVSDHYATGVREISGDLSKLMLQARGLLWQVEQ